MSGKKPFLFEIGTDELPARFLPIEREHVAGAFAALSEELGLACEGLRVLATPRRLAILAAGLAERQPERTVELKGPPLAVAFGPDGEPTPAAMGFARKNGLDLADCGEVSDEKGGLFLGASKVVPGRSAAELLAERLPALLLSIPFPKTMHWGDSDLEYARPIQWLVCLLGDAVVPIALAGRTAGRVSRGHRTLHDGKPVEIAAPGGYLDALRGAGVIADQEERARTIGEGGARLAAAEGGRLVADDELLAEVVDLCEHPTPFVGAMPDTFSELPDEVVVTALKAHQRYFAMRSAQSGALLPRFFAVRDGDGTALENVVRGNEKVLNARLSDALFYWRCDRKLSPDQHTERLADVTWLEGFGSVLDRVERIGRLVAWLWENGLGEGDVPDDLTRAAAICKFDLVTEMIRDGKEFTKLEGTIGARYAAAAGENPAVCGILAEYYRPRSATDELPGDPASSALAAADRLDSLAGCWLAGFAPTGTKDPYALRRGTLAVLRILIDRDLHLDLAAALARALEGFAGVADSGRRTAAGAEIGDFVRTRLEGHLVSLGHSPEAVRAVLDIHGNDPTVARDWAAALDLYRGREDFLQLAKGFKRCRNILEGEILADRDRATCLDRWLAGGASPDGRGFGDLPESAERGLRDAVAAATPELAAKQDAADYQAVLETLSSLGPAIDAFFDQVRVNVDDAGLRERRHAFLREIFGLFTRFANFWEVAPLEEDG